MYTLAFSALVMILPCACQSRRQQLYKHLFLFPLIMHDGSLLVLHDMHLELFHSQGKRFMQGEKQLTALKVDTKNGRINSFLEVNLLLNVLKVRCQKILDVKCKKNTTRIALATPPLNYNAIFSWFLVGIARIPLSS